jgi:hypothetical protein
MSADKRHNPYESPHSTAVDSAVGETRRDNKPGAAWLLLAYSWPPVLFLVLPIIPILLKAVVVFLLVASLWLISRLLRGLSLRNAVFRFAGIGCHLYVDVIVVILATLVPAGPPPPYSSFPPTEAGARQSSGADKAAEQDAKDDHPSPN